MSLLDSTLTEKFEYQLEVLPIDYVIQIRRADIILRGEQEIARSYHRSHVSPGDDLTGEPEEVVKVANALWTPEIIAAYQAANPTEDTTEEDEEDSVSTADIIE